VRKRRAISRRLFLCFVCLAAGVGCRDEIARPTLGFLEIETGGVQGVQVLLDGEVHSGPGVLGPLEPGSHTVRVTREFYDVSPDSLLVTVAPADTARAEFALDLVEAGNIRVTARDEILGTEIEGAEIYLGGKDGPLARTGVLTPGLLERVPPGGARVQVKVAGREDSAVLPVTVTVLETVDAELELGPLRAVLAEMFTYVICPNCPPAADELEDAHADLPGEVYVIEWHTWSGLPLYHARWRERERFYTGGTTIGYPAVVFQGGYLEAPQERLIIGSEASDLALYRARIANYLGRCANDCPVALVSTGTIDGSSAEVTASVKRRAGSVPGSLVLRFVLIECAVVAPGNDPPYSFVPRDMVELSLALPSEGEVAEFDASLPVAPGWQVNELEVVTYIQSEATGEILAVGGLR
jgi:hypothetical protein